MGLENMNSEEKDKPKKSRNPIIYIILFFILIGTGYVLYLHFTLPKFDFSVNSEDVVLESKIINCKPIDYIFEGIFEKERLYQSAGKEYNSKYWEEFVENPNKFLSNGDESASILNAELMVETNTFYIASNQLIEESYKEIGGNDKIIDYHRELIENIPEFKRTNNLKNDRMSCNKMHESVISFSFDKLESNEIFDYLKQQGCDLNKEDYDNNLEYYENIFMSRYKILEEFYNNGGNFLEEDVIEKNKVIGDIRIITEGVDYRCESFSKIIHDFITIKNAENLTNEIKITVKNEGKVDFDKKNTETIAFYVNSYAIKEESRKCNKEELKAGQEMVCTIPNNELTEERSVIKIVDGFGNGFSYIYE